MNGIQPTEYSPQTNMAMIDAIPEDVYNFCPCGCGQKWRFVVKSGKAEEHIRKFCDEYERKNGDKS